jgi:hypothetical protein
MSRYRRGTLLATVAVALGVTGCGTAAAGGSGSAPSVLPARAVAYLPSSLKPLTVRGLTREAGAPTLAHDLRLWGFRAGFERYFQGESRRLQVVDSRMLRFSSTTGAAAFVRFVAGHPSPYLGSFAGVRALDVDGRHGKLLIAQPCQCHLANPALLGIVASGTTVSWLEINGPRATRSVLVSLMARGS